jgi:hypothetical protein
MWLPGYASTLLALRAPRLVINKNWPGYPGNDVIHHDISLPHQQKTPHTWARIRQMSSSDSDAFPPDKVFILPGLGVRVVIRCFDFPTLSCYLADNPRHTLANCVQDFLQNEDPVPFPGTHWLIVYKTFYRMRTQFPFRINGHVDFLHKRICICAIVL